MHGRGVAHLGGPSVTTDPAPKGRRGQSHARRPVDCWLVHDWIGPVCVGRGAVLLGGRGVAHRCADVLRGLVVLHVGGVPAVPRGRRCSPGASRLTPPYVLGVGAAEPRLAGVRGTARRHAVVQLEYRKRATHQPQCGGHRSAGVATRRPGSIAFLVASGLALMEARRGVVAGRPKARTWKSCVANMVGSVAFGVSAVASYVVPATGNVWNAELTNLGTFVGAVCFFIGAILLLPPETATAPVPADRAS